MSAWKDLPNDKHIDWVLESLKTHPQLWHDTHNKEWAQAYDQAWDQAYDQAWDQARSQASYACLALIAYDGSVKYLSMTSDQLKVWIELSEDSAAILLLPMVQVKEKLNQLIPVV